MKFTFCGDVAWSVLLYRRIIIYVHYRLEDAKHVLLVCTETKKWRAEFLCKKWMELDQDLAFKKIIGCKNAVEL
jgi:hypothetical protein